METEQQGGVTATAEQQPVAIAVEQQAAVVEEDAVDAVAVGLGAVRVMGHSVAY